MAAMSQHHHLASWAWLLTHMPCASTVRSVAWVCLFICMLLPRAIPWQCNVPIHTYAMCQHNPVTMQACPFTSMWFPRAVLWWCGRTGSHNKRCHHSFAWCTGKPAHTSAMSQQHHLASQGQLFTCVPCPGIIV